MNDPTLKKVMELLMMPDDALLHICSFLNFKELISCASTCHRLHDLCTYDQLWKRQCQFWWDTYICPDGMRWKENFSNWFKDFSKYITVYRHISRAWKQIEKFLKEHCPAIYESLEEGLTEEELNVAERKIGLPLPLDLRCVYRFHNGQEFLFSEEAQKPLPFGLFGTIKFSRFFASEVLLPMEFVESGMRNEHSGHCIAPIACIRTGLRVFLVPDGPLHNQISGPLFYSPVRDYSQPFADFEGDCNVFLKGQSFMEFFVAFAQHLSEHQFPVNDGEILRFHHDKEAEAVTEEVHISVATAFMPMMSHANPPDFVFAYRITMSMNKDAHPKYACQLESRHWIITDADGHVDEVKGPGVVGEYPIVRPGSTYNYISCTSFKTKEGTMQGTYTMRILDTGKPLDVVVPLFRMKCPPVMTL